MTRDRLLEEFPPVSTESWEDLILRDLKGANYAEKLIWRAQEGLAVKPYYRVEDIKCLEFLGAAPGEFPYVRGNCPTGGWLIREEIGAADPEEANRAALSAVAAGAEEVAFTRARIGHPSDVGLLLANLDEVPVHFACVDRDSVQFLIERLRKRPHRATVSAGLNPVADMDATAEIICNAPAAFVPFVIDAEKFQEQGATAAEEVGYALAAGVDLLAEMQQRRLDAVRVGEAISFSFAMGPEIFIQIAKLRAFRMVWAQAAESFGCSPEKAKARMHARTPRWNQTVYDAHINLLRATTEAISAALGGADSIFVEPFDACYKQPDDISRRLARNIQILLKQEAMLSRVADPGGGAYAVEAITDSIAGSAWKIFQELEAGGGYRKAIDSGVIASVLGRRLQDREAAVACRKRVLTGANRFANASERALGRVGDLPVESPSRAAEAFEKLRLRTERHTAKTGTLPRILLAEFGDAKMRGARSQFSAEFLACAGLETRTERFQDIDGIATADADLIVLCSSDAEYLTLATELLPKLRAKRPSAIVLIAGTPETVAELSRLGVAGFISIRSNAIETLTSVQHMMGIGD